MRKAMVLLLSAVIMQSAAAVFAETGMKDMLTTIYSRKSVRNFTGAPVSKADIETIIKAGMAAPTAVNMQPWSFIILTDKTKMAQLGEKLPYAKMLSKAGAAIVVCTDPEKAYGGSRSFAIIDASCASENMLLTIEALGLGGLWTAVYPVEERMKVIRETLGIPENVIPLNLIPVGYPTGADKPKDKFKKDKMHWEKW